VAPTTAELLGTGFFALALVHTFSIKYFQNCALKYPEGSVQENLFHLLGEVEVVFGLWAGILVAALAVESGLGDTIQYVESQNFTEPIFVFVIMSMAATRPILNLASRSVELVSRVLPISRSLAFYWTALVLGPLAGSLITEPAAMTVTALLLRKRFFERRLSSNFLYATLAVLFVNISVGGVLTAYAAPPVLMVAGKWGWTSGFMWSHFGWKALIAVVVNATALAYFFRKKVGGLPELSQATEEKPKVPVWLTVVHTLFIAAVVLTAHHPVFFTGLFLFFLGVGAVTTEYQDELKLKESLLVAFFLGGLIVLGSFQKWWLLDLMASVNEPVLFVGATFLTGFVDNAALTFLGTQLPDLSASLRYALVAGAVAGGGLTVIANAPNPAGYSLLRDSFGASGIQPLQLFLYALAPTAVAMIAFWCL